MIDQLERSVQPDSRQGVGGRPQRKNLGARLLTAMLIAAVLISILPAAGPAAAQSTVETTEAAGPLTVTDESDGVLIQWDAGDVTAASLDDLPTVRYGGYDLPMRLVTVTPANGASAATAPQIQALDATAWDGALPTARPMTPPALGIEDDPFISMQEEPQALPTAPVFLYSQGRVRGQDVQIFAVSPLFEEAGEIKVARQIQARIEQAQGHTGAVAALASSAVQASAAAPNIGIGATDDLSPSNAPALRKSVRVLVENPGIQQIPLAEIETLGLNSDPLRITHKGQQVPFEVEDGMVRFYAQAAGDYWNATDVYWLTNQNGRAMETRAVPPGNAPSRTTAVETGVWRDNAKYVSQHAGPDADHWYAADMKADPGMQGNPDDYPVLVADLNPQLPLSGGGQSRFVPNLTTYIKGEYELELKVGNTTEQLSINTVNNAASAALWQPEALVNGTATVLQLTLTPGDTIAGLLVDSIAWEQPVALQLNGKGVTFSGVDGAWQYQLAGTPQGYRLYDISDPAAPQRLTGINNATFEDEDVKRYLITGPGTLHTPALEAHSPVSFKESDAADALYIAPAEFIDALAPLVEFRESQGYRVKVIDVQEIYDAWGYGYVAPDAIRSFLRFAVANWNPSPISAVLVSDGTRDPFNYENRQSGVNHIPPYLRTSFTDQNGFERYVDPWLGQNGCDNCYAQLDGADPLDNEFETPGKGFLTDIWLGRFPVKSAQEVAGVVSKIITYESAQETPAYWRRTAGFLADDYIRPDGSPDSAGDFIGYSEEVIELLPSGVNAARVYYDPQSTSSLPWYEPDATQVRQRAIELAGSGPGLLTYNGHANHWQWAGTALTSENPYIFGLFDVDLLQNKDQLFVNLSMTCYTAQFFQPSNSGTTLDERMFVHPGGGAAAVWGPSGLSVLHGHDDLQYGFHKLLWESAPGTMRMGELMDAGYYENFSPSSEREKLYSCCEDVRRTFLLLGDPLMTVQMTPSNDVYLPMVLNR